MDEITPVGIERMAGDIPFVEPLHDDDLGRCRGVGLARRQGFVVGPDRLLAFDVALGLLDRVRVIENLDVAAAAERGAAHGGC